MGLNSQHPRFVPVALYGSLGRLFGVSQQNCLTEERGAWCGHSMQMNITFFCKAALEHLTCGIWGRGQLFVYTYS